MHEREKWVCPVCGLDMGGPDLLCNGSFLDRDHPSAVRPVLAPETDTPRPEGDA